MPALRVFDGGDGRAPGESGRREGLSWAKVAHEACPAAISNTAYRVLGAMDFYTRNGDCGTEATDAELGRQCGKSRPTVQRALVELEKARWIHRLRRRGRRRIVLLQTLAGKETRWAKGGPEGASEVINACIRNEGPTAQKRSLHVSEMRPLLKTMEEGEKTPETPAAAAGPKARGPLPPPAGRGGKGPSDVAPGALTADEEAQHRRWLALGPGDVMYRVAYRALSEAGKLDGSEAPPAARGRPPGGGSKLGVSPAGRPRGTGGADPCTDGAENHPDLNDHN